MKRSIQAVVTSLLGLALIGCNAESQQTTNPSSSSTETPMSELSPNLAPSPAPEAPDPSAESAP